LRQDGGPGIEWCRKESVIDGRILRSSWALFDCCTNGRYGSPTSPAREAQFRFLLDELEAHSADKEHCDVAVHLLADAVLTTMLAGPRREPSHTVTSMPLAGEGSDVLRDRRQRLLIPASGEPVP
jgi:hypothetical protein